MSDKHPLAQKHDDILFVLTDTMAYTVDGKLLQDAEDLVFRFPVDGFGEACEIAGI